MRKLLPLILLPAILSLGLITKDCSNPVLVSNLNIPGEVVVYAQQTPIQLHLAWTASADAGVVSYSAFVNGVRSTSYAASSVCQQNSCIGLLTVPSYGKYSVYVVAQAYLFDFDPSSLTDSGPSNTVTFSVNPPPSSAPANLQVKK